MTSHMLAKKYEGDALPYPHWIEPKVDGLRAAAIVKDGRVTFVSRLGNEFNNTEHVQSALLSLSAKSVVYDGELYAGEWGLTSGILHTKDRHPQAARLYFAVFDVMSVEDWGRGRCDTSQAIRRRMIEELMFQHHGTSVRVMPGKTVKTSVEVREFAETCVRQGFEGAMLKDPRAPYVGKRASHWRKVKFVETMDVKITGAQPGKGKHLGRLGAVTVLINGVESQAGTGFDDDERETLWAMHERGELAGKIAEVRFQEITKKDGRMRFPVFVRLRLDKA